MLNQIVLVGRLTDDVKLTETENGKKVSSLILAVPRAYKNSDGIYETDFIKCTLWNAIASSTAEYCKKGDLVGIKGRLQVTSYEEENIKKYSTEVVAEKVTFLSTNTTKNTKDLEEE